MKKYILSSLAVLSAATLFTSCNDMLDTDPRVTEMTQATFPGKVADVEALNAATYTIMNTMGGGDSDANNPFYAWEVMSDNCYGSGGLQDYKVKSYHHLVTMSANQFEMMFTLLYGGISRANNQIETIDRTIRKPSATSFLAKVTLCAVFTPFGSPNCMAMCHCSPLPQLLQRWRSR